MKIEGESQVDDDTIVGECAYVCMYSCHACMDGLMDARMRAREHAHWNSKACAKLV